MLVHCSSTDRHVSPAHIPYSGSESSFIRSEPTTHQAIHHMKSTAMYFEPCNVPFIHAPTSAQLGFAIVALLVQTFATGLVKDILGPVGTSWDCWFRSE